MPDVNDLAAQLERAMQAARALPVPEAAAEAAAPAPTVPVASTPIKRRKPRLAVVKTVPVKTPTQGADQDATRHTHTCATPRGLISALVRRAR